MALREQKVTGEDWEADLTLTETYSGGRTYQEASLKITIPVGDHGDILGRLVRQIMDDEDVAKELRGISRTCTIKRGFEGDGDSNPRISFFKITIIPDPMGRWEDDASNAFNAPWIAVRFPKSKMKDETHSKP